MIPSSTVNAFYVAAAFTLIAPVIIMIILGAKKKIRAIPLLVGAGAFFLSQIVLRMPLINALSTQAWYQDFAKNFLLYVFLLSLSAGLFEESARLGGAVLLKKNRSFEDAVSFGLGHAFCEVIILIGLMHINNITICLLINSGSDAAAVGLSADALKELSNAFGAINSADIYWGILERFSAVLFHVFATVLVFRGVIEKRARLWFLAVIAHTFFNVTGVLLAQYAGVAASELALLALALAAGAYTLKQKSSFAPPADAAVETP